MVRRLMRRLRSPRSAARSLPERRAALEHAQQAWTARCAELRAAFAQARAQRDQARGALALLTELEAAAAEEPDERA